MYTFNNSPGKKKVKAVTVSKIPNELFTDLFFYLAVTSDV